MDQKKIIIEKARELSQKIAGHEVSTQYIELTARIKDDRKAQLLMRELVMMGRVINDTMSSSIEYRPMGTAEAEQLQRELENTPYVKEYILAQKNYLEMMKKITLAIKNPKKN